MSIELPDFNPFHHDDKDKALEGLKVQVVELGKKLTEAQAEITTLSKASNNDVVKDLTAQLQVMTGDRNEYRDKYNDTLQKLSDANSKIEELNGHLSNVNNGPDRGHHFGG